MIVNGQDLGPMMPVANGNTETGIQRHSHGYRATKHFVIAQYPGGSWRVMNEHGLTSQFYEGAEQALEMAEYLESQPVDWSTIFRNWQLPALIVARGTSKHSELSKY